MYNGKCYITDDFLFLTFKPVLLPDSLFPKLSNCLVQTANKVLKCSHVSRKDNLKGKLS